MGLSRSLVAVLVSACLAYYAVLADASPARRPLAESGPTLAGLGRLLPRTSLAASAVLTTRQGLSALRRVVQASALMHDSRPSEATSRQAHVALWAELETGLRPAPADSRPDPSGLLPGQD
jgi:hypothetical protein